MGALTFYSLQSAETQAEPFIDLLNKKKFIPINKASKQLLTLAGGWVSLENKNFLETEPRTAERHEIDYLDAKVFGLRIDKLVLPAAVRADMEAKLKDRFYRGGVLPKDDRKSFKAAKNSETERLMRQQTPTVKVIPVYMFDDLVVVGSGSTPDLAAVENIFTSTFEGSTLFPLCAYELLKVWPQEKIEKFAQGQMSIDGVWLQNRNAFAGLHEKFLAWCAKGFSDPVFDVYLSKNLGLKDETLDIGVSVKNPQDKAASQLMKIASEVTQVGLVVRHDKDLYQFSLDKDFRVRGFKTEKVRGLEGDDARLHHINRIKKLRLLIAGMFSRFMETV